MPYFGRVESSLLSRNDWELGEPSENLIPISRLLGVALAFVAGANDGEHLA